MDAAAVMFLHSVPAGAAMGAIGGLATRLRLSADGEPPHKAGRNRPLGDAAGCLSVSGTTAGAAGGETAGPHGGLWGPAVV